MRKPVFDTIRTVRGKGFSPAEVAAVDALLDQLAIPRDDGAAAAAVPSASDAGIVLANARNGLDDRQAFFDAVVRLGLFRAPLKEDQEGGLDALLKAAGAAGASGWPLAFTAYALATAYHETAFTMQPVREAFWLSEEWRRRNLRYHPYYGRGYVQLTWRRNYELADNELGLGGRLLQNLDLAMDCDIAARIAVRGMEEGWFCRDANGPHTLKRHVPEAGPATMEQFKSARRIINGTDKAAKIADEAMRFQEALQAGRW